MTFASRNRYFHAIDGRMRFSAEGLKGCPAQAEGIELCIQAIEGVLEVSANPKTGNVLVLYNSDEISHERLVIRLAELGYLYVNPSTNGHSLDSSGTRLTSSKGLQLMRRFAGIAACTAAELAVKRAVAALI